MFCSTIRVHIEHNLFTDYVRLILISTSDMYENRTLKTTYLFIVEHNPSRTKH
jgi:hypothetical protein